MKVHGRHVAAGTGLAMMLVAGYLWYALFSVRGYQPPADLEPIDQQREHRVFSYGTLRIAALRRLIVGNHPTPEPATLNGYQRSGLNIIPKEDAVVNGIVFVVSAAQLQRLDRYERLGVRYLRTKMTLADGSIAWVYHLE